MSLDEQLRTAMERVSHLAGFDHGLDHLVIGVSGGPDSLALLHALRKHITADQLIVAHLDHGLRPSSAAEAQQVEGMAEGLRFYAERVDVARLAKEQGQSLEEAGRIARYDLLARVATNEGASHVAVGHNADDQVETILMHVLRGSGLAGLRGMQMVSPMPGHPGVWLLRPFLGLSRQEIETYCAINELAPILDESNADPSFLRNRLRTELLPLLEAYNPQIRQRLVEMGRIISAEEDLLNSQTLTMWERLLVEQEEALIVLQRDQWRSLPLALRRRILRHAVAAVHPATGDVSFRALESAREIAEEGQTGASANLPDGVSVLANYEHLIIQRDAANLTEGYPQLTGLEPRPLPVPGVIPLAGGWRLTAEWLSREDITLAEIRHNQDEWRAYAAIGAADALFIRPRLAGERMRPLGLGGERKVKEIMIDRKIPRFLRERWPVVATPDHAVWLAGHVLDERARVTEAAERIVRLHCRPPAGHEPG